MTPLEASLLQHLPASSSTKPPGVLKQPKQPEEREKEANTNELDVSHRPTISLRVRVFDKVKHLAKKSRSLKRHHGKDRWKQCLQRQFNALPKHETDALQQVFHQFDKDKSGKLEGNEIMPCLTELGLRGANSSENREINKSLRLLMDISQKDGEEVMSVSFLDFALKVVPQVRQRLVELRSNEMLRLFLHYDVQGFGTLRVEQCVEIVRSLDLDRRLFLKIYEEVYGPMKITLDFEEFQNLVVILKERTERIVREHERGIKQKTGISDEVFQQFRTDIVSLFELFQKADEDENGTLARNELLRVLGEFGLLPKSLKERLEVDAILQEVDTNGDACIDFCEFLHLTSLIRSNAVEKRRIQNNAIFEKYDRDGNRQLSIEEISALLSDLGIVPTDRKEQEELAVLIRQVDQSSDGFIDFEEFQTLCQRIDEHLKSMHYQQEIDYALHLGFSEGQLYELRCAFDALDVDASGRLDAQEVRSGLAMMRKHVSQEMFDSSFAVLDADGSGELDFKEYLDLMKLLRDGEGLFSEDESKLPSKMKWLDSRMQRRALEYFKLSKGYIISLSKQESMDLLCFFLNVKPADNLHDKFKVTTYADFLDLCKNRGAEAQAK